MDWFSARVLFGPGYYIPNQEYESAAVSFDIPGYLAFDVNEQEVTLVPNHLVMQVIVQGHRMTEKSA